MTTTVDDYGNIVDDGSGAGGTTYYENDGSTSVDTGTSGGNTYHENDGSTSTDTTTVTGTGTNTGTNTSTNTSTNTGNGWQTDEVGNKYKYDANGTVQFQANGKTYSWDSTKKAFTDPDGKIAGDQAGFLGLAKKLFVNADGTLKPNAIGAIGGGLLGAIGAFQPKIEKVGYQGGLKDLVAQRTMATTPVAGYRPGAGGTNYGGDVQYTERSANAAAPAAPVQTLQPNTTVATNPWAGKMNRNFATPGASATALAATPADTTATSNVMTPAQLLAAQESGAVTHAAQGGIMGLAHGGRYLQGETDGMADKLRTSIDGKQPAALSHGEFVIPADVVSHLGNGNSDAGAKKLYGMMDKIRHARTGTKKQGKQINPDKFMPGGLAAAYAAGGSVQKFVEGGGIGSVPAGTTGVDQTLASWTGTYAPDMLSKTTALTSAPYQQYKGALTAGASDLQNQAFAGASENAQAGYTPTQFTTGTFDTAAANKYMNPYLQASLNPQLAELQRQAKINNMSDAAKLTQGGAYGGGRQAVLMGEQNRNLLDKSSGLLSSGYNTAYNNAMQQFNADQARNLDTQKSTEASRQYGADYGIKSLNQLSDLGATQRGITAEGVAADKKAFEEARDNPFNMLKFQSQMLNGLPIQATNYSTAMPSTAQQTLAGAGGVAGMLGNKTTITQDDVTSLLRQLGFTI